MAFDIGTAVLFIGLQAVLAAVALIIAWRIHYQEPAASYWAFGYSTIALGTVAFLLRGAVTNPTAVIIAGNTMIAAGHFLLNIGFATFTSRPRPWRAFAAVILGTFVATAYFTLAEPHAKARLAIIGLAIIVSCTLIIRDLLSDHEPGRRTARLTLAAFYALHLWVNAVHIGLTAMADPMVDFYQGSWLQKVWIVWDTVVLFLFPFGILLMSSEKLLDRLDRLASHDELTGLLNRRAFNLRLGEEHSRARRNRRTVAVLMLDLDRFKSLNDSHGHAAGDLMLQSFTWTVGRLLRREDIFARIGGEEFCILLPDTDSTGASLVAERIRSEVEALHVPHRSSTLTGTVSIGIAMLGPEEPDPAAVLRAADAALYRAKSQGRNTVVLSDRPARMSRATPEQ